MTDPIEKVPFIRAQEITKRFGGVVALNDVSVDFFAGEVHCIAGENGCGKSTLMKTLSGAHRPDYGQLIIDGVSHAALTPKQSFKLGLDVIYQDFSLLPNLSAAENIAFPGLAVSRRPGYRRADAAALAEHALEQLGVDIPLDVPVEELSVAERQLCAIARALAHSARFIAMDEPTTALTWREVDALFKTVDGLRQRGVSVVFISHKLQEVFAVSDRVTVMRNGRVVASGPPGDFTPASLAETMTGRSALSISRPVSTIDNDPPALRVIGLGRPPLFDDVTLTVGQGEVVGLAGLLGSGRTEIAEAIAGVLPATRGTVEVLGKTVDASSLASAFAAGIGYVPEDRLTQGLFLDQSIADNIGAATVERYSGRGGIIRAKAFSNAVKDAIARLRIKIGTPTDPVRSLSGGNAQRVLLAKWLSGEPQVLILNGPTVGVDVGSKYDIQGVMTAQSLQGLGVLIISDDIPELIAMCHRVLLVKSGRIVGELQGAALTEERLVEEITQ